MTTGVQIRSGHRSTATAAARDVPHRAETAGLAVRVRIGADLPAAGDREQRVRQDPGAARRLPRPRRRLPAAGGSV